MYSIYYFTVEDDRASLFSEHRSQGGVTESHMTNDSSSNSSQSDQSMCPVDTTYVEDNHGNSAQGKLDYISYFLSYQGHLILIRST